MAGANLSRCEPAKQGDCILDKESAKIGVWKFGKVPKHDFPMGRQAYRLGPSHDWCVITFEALGRQFRVLVILHEEKQKYSAILGIMHTGKLRILCAYEFHAGEPGWHCHATCDDSETIPYGVMRGPWIRRIPKAASYHSDKSFTIDKNAAIHRALDRYKIEEDGPLL